MFLDEIALRSNTVISDAEFDYLLKNTNLKELPLDIRIQLEAYKNQALVGDNPYSRPERYSMVLETLLHDAWSRLKGTSKSAAKMAFVELIKNYQKNLSVSF